MLNGLIVMFMVILVLLSFVMFWNSQQNRENAIADLQFEEDWEQAKKEALEQVFGGKKL